VQSVCEARGKKWLPQGFRDTLRQFVIWGISFTSPPGLPAGVKTFEATGLQIKSEIALDIDAGLPC
jgi:hypothetical protein